MIGAPVVPTAPPRMITVYAGYCPLGSQCHRNNSRICKKRTEEEARAAIQNHLCASSYHELQEADAKTYADSAEITPLEEEESWWTSGAWKVDANPSRPRLAIRGQPQPSSPSTGPWTLARLSGAAGERATQTVTLSTAEIDACVTSLRRAGDAAEASADLCSRAARAFTEEARCIQACKEVLESYAP